MGTPIVLECVFQKELFMLKVKLSGSAGAGTGGGVAGGRVRSRALVRVCAVVFLLTGCAESEEAKRLAKDPELVDIGVFEGCTVKYVNRYYESRSFYLARCGETVATTRMMSSGKTSMQKLEVTTTAGAPAATVADTAGSGVPVDKVKVAESAELQRLGGETGAELVARAEKMEADAQLVRKKAELWKKLSKEDRVVLGLPAE